MQSNGVEYEGDFVGNLPDGQGTTTFSAPHPEAAQKQVGEYREGNIHKGTVTFSAPHQRAGVKYVGELRDRNPHGQGTKTFRAPHRKAGEEKAGIWENHVLMTGTRTFITPHERAGEKEIWKTGSLLKTIYPSKSEPVTERPEPEKSQETPLEKYESKCLNLGFTKGTEKFGDCVMKLMDRL